DNGSPHRASPSGQRCTAQNHGGDSVQVVALTYCRVSRYQLTRGDQTSHGGTKTTNHVHAHFDAIDVDPGKLSGAFVSADGIDLATKRRLPRDKRGNGRENHHDPNYDGNPKHAAGA